MSSLHIFNPKVGPEPAHRHKNPGGGVGGWVAETATVEPTVHVSKSAKVYGEATVGGAAVILDECRVYGTAKVGGKVCLSGIVRVHGNSRLGGDARVHGKVRISDSSLSDHVIVQGNAGIFDTVLEGNANIMGDRILMESCEVSGSTLIRGGRFSSSEISGLATVVDNPTLTKTTVSGRARISGKAHLTSCIVGGEFHVGGDAELKGCSAEIAGEVSGTASLNQVQLSSVYVTGDTIIDHSVLHGTHAASAVGGTGVRIRKSRILGSFRIREKVNIQDSHFTGSICLEEVDIQGVQVEGRALLRHNPTFKVSSIITGTVKVDGDEHPLSYCYAKGEDADGNKDAVLYFYGPRKPITAYCHGFDLTDASGLANGPLTMKKSSVDHVSALISKDPKKPFPIPREGALSLSTFQQNLQGYKPTIQALIMLLSHM